MTSLRNIGWTWAGLMALAAMGLGSTQALAQRGDQRQPARSYNSHRQSPATRSSSHSQSRRPSASVSFGRSGHLQVRIGSRSPSYGHQSSGHHTSGRYVMQSRRVLVSNGHYHRRYTPAVYGNRHDAHGGHHRAVIQPAYYKNVWVPPRYEYRQTRVWVPGYRTGSTSQHSGYRH